MPLNVSNKPAVVYEILNIENGSRYIGSSTAINLRFNAHKNLLLNNKHHNVHLQSAWNLYGEEAFEFKVLLFCDRETMLWFEQLCIDKLHPEYNIAKYANAPMLGRTHTEKARKMLSLLWRGRKHTPETIQKMHNIKLGKNNPFYGKQHTQEFKRLMSIRVTGKNHPLYGRKGKDNPRYGQHHSDEAKKKISAALLGIKRSEESRNRMSEAQKRRWERWRMEHVSEDKNL